jgi:hypothetical protein
MNIEIQVVGPYAQSDAGGGEKVDSRRSYETQPDTDQTQPGKHGKYPTPTWVPAV